MVRIIYLLTVVRWLIETSHGDGDSSYSAILTILSSTYPLGSFIPTLQQISTHSTRIRSTLTWLK